MRVSRFKGKCFIKDTWKENDEFSLKLRTPYGDVIIDKSGLLPEVLEIIVTSIHKSIQIIENTRNKGTNL